MENRNPTAAQSQTPAPGSVVSMASGEKKESGTGKSRGNKRGSKVGFDFEARFKEQADQHFRALNIEHVAHDRVLMDKLIEAADASGNSALADALRGSTPTDLGDRVRANVLKPITRSDIILVVGGALVVGLVWHGVAYLLRNKIAIPTIKKFETGIAADRRALGNSKPRASLQVPARQ